MSYMKEFEILKKRFSPKEKKIDLPEFDMEILNVPFESENYMILPGESSYNCKLHNTKFINGHKIDMKDVSKEVANVLKVDDSKIKENRYFNFPLFRKTGETGSDDIIILFHGLNEKSWDKYLPWAKKLVESTGKTVLMFPLAFHMNRTPSEWIDPRLMRKVSEEKKRLFPRTKYSSIANAALNMRLQFMPLRFLWSGLQSLYDVIQLVRSVKNGEIPFVSSSAGIEFFAYSIGSFLAEILLMLDPEKMFSDSKLFNFCGGPVLTRTSPVSKYILDSETNISVYTFFIEYLDLEIEKNERLSHYFGPEHPEGEIFRSMIDYQKMKGKREKRFRELSGRIMALGLKNDEVIPPFEIINTLKGEQRKIPIKVKILDFNYKYDHVIPFPANWNLEKEVDAAFNKTFRIASKFLK